MFRIILLSVVTVMHVYVFLRAGSVPLLKRYVPRKLFIALGVALWVAFFSGRIFGHGGEGIFARMIELVGMNWMGMLFLLFLSFLAVDIITVFGFFLSRKVPLLRGLALAVGAALSLIALVQGMRPPVIQKYDIYLSGLPDEMDGTVIVAVSDLHIGSLLGERWLDARADQVEAEQPDLVVLLGDLFEGHGQPPLELLGAFSRFSAPLGTWAVRGNHEAYDSQKTSEFLIEKAGFHLLSDTWVEIKPGFVLAGLDDIHARRGFITNKTLFSKTLNGRPEGITILLSHRPIMAQVAADKGVDLMLSGHTHGGQIWPFGYLIRRYYPLFEGRYDVNGMTVIVSRGAGSWGTRMRLWRPGEILRLTLYKKT